MSPSLNLSMLEPDIALLTFDTPDKRANILSTNVLEELATHLDDLEKRDDLEGLIFASGKPGMFIAGANLEEFVQSLDAPKEDVVAICRRGQTLFARFTKCPFVTVAAIDGICVGGGAELAIWCDRRVLSDGAKTEYGFPEVKLGLFPGWGGTIRAPRIVGLSNAVELITGGDSMDPQTAQVMGMASDVVPADRLLQAATNVIRNEQSTGEYLADRRRWSAAMEVNETELGFLGITASALIQQQTKGQYPAPVAALELMMESAFVDAEAACQMEAEGMAGLFGSPVNAALLNIFFLQDRIKKDRGVAAENITSRDITHVGVIGAGIMGAGIAAANIKRGVPVVLSDMSDEALQKGATGVLEEVAYNRKTKSADAAKAVELGPLLNTASGDAADAELAACDLVVEAVVENADVKEKIYANLEPQLRDDAILASNTSTIPITGLAEDLKRPEQFCGIHFFNPVRRMKLVEVIRGEKTNDETVATAVTYAKRIGKMPIVVNDGPGFLVNRLLFPYMNESVELLCDGAPIKDIERAAKKFGMPMGPIELFDMVGLDTSVYAGRTMVEAFPDRFIASPVLPSLLKGGRLGKKSGAGFYSYNNRKQRPEPDPELPKLLEIYMREPQEFSPDDLTSRLFLPMLLEATRALEDRIVRDVRDVDFGLIFGLGFPPFKGGLLHWADTLGAATILEMLKPLEELGERMKPTELLLDMAKQNRRFYQ